MNSHQFTTRRHVALLIVGLTLVLIVSMGFRTKARTNNGAHWNIEFIPDEVESVSVNINNEAWTTWHSSQGHVRWYLPPQWANLHQIHVYAAAHPEGKNAHIRVFWDDTERQNMEFDNDEDHDVSRP